MGWVVVNHADRCADHRIVLRGIPAWRIVGVCVENLSQTRNQQQVEQTVEHRDLPRLVSDHLGGQQVNKGRVQTIAV